MTERTVWTGRPSLRPLVFNPVYLAGWFFVGWLLLAGFEGRRFPGGVNLFPEVDTWYLAAAVVAVPLLLWPLSTLATRYRLTDQRLVLSQGILTRTLDEIELYRVRDVRLTRSIPQRLLGIGTVVVGSSDGTGEIAMRSISSSGPVREAVRQASEDCKRTRTVAVSA